MHMNADLLNATLQSGLAAGDTLIIPNKTFHMYGGILASGLRNVTIQIDGTIKFATDLTIQKLRKAWPSRNGKVMNCIELSDLEDVLFTSSGIGTLDGNGHKWWGAINYAIYQENRPKILQISDSARLVVEHLHFLDSPYWTTDFKDVNTVTIRYCDVAVRVKAGATTHSSDELTAFNTDGFDLSGANIHIHDCNIWNQDDCVCVKDLNNGKRAQRSENWLVERVHASGLGLTIGSIGCSTPPMTVRNITFRDSVMDNTFKGLYMKSRWCTGNNTAVIEDILCKTVVYSVPRLFNRHSIPLRLFHPTDVCFVCVTIQITSSLLATSPRRKHYHQQARAVGGVDWAGPAGGQFARVLCCLAPGQPRGEVPNLAWGHLEKHHAARHRHQRPEGEPRRHHRRAGQSHAGASVR
jgi:hypothetical protein